MEENPQAMSTPLDRTSARFPDPTPRPRGTLREAVGIVCLGIVIGVIVNALSPRGIPWVGDFSRGAALANRSAEELKELPAVIELADLKTALAEGDSLLVLLDARAPDAYAAGHLPGALNLPAESLDASYPPLKAKLTASNRIIVYCDGGDCELSHDLANALKDFGHTRIQLFAGGVNAWMENGGTLTTGEQP